MAITKVGAMTDPPVAGDYAILQAKLDAYAKQIGNQGMILTQWTNTTTAPKIAMGSYITHGGTLFIVDTEDFAVTEPAGDGTYYLKVAASGDTLAVAWVASLSGYTWNAIYNGLYHSDESQILPYQLVKSGATLTKRKITNLMQGSGFVTVDWTGAMQSVYFDQGVKTTDSPTFANATISGHNVDTQLDRINQDLKTTANPTFLGIITTNGPNKPVDNNDASMPSVGIGGFSYALGSSDSGAPTITIGSGGTWVYVAVSSSGSSTSAQSGKVAGGSSIQGMFGGSSGTTVMVSVIAWRIA